MNRKRAIAVASILALSIAAWVILAGRTLSGTAHCDGRAFLHRAPLPRIMLWAWERPEELDFIDAHEKRCRVVEVCEGGLRAPAYALREEPLGDEDEVLVLTGKVGFAFRLGPETSAGIVLRDRFLYVSEAREG